MTEQPQPTPPPRERPIWGLNRDEQRVLFIAFVGGVASIVAAAVIVGVAIALAHAIFPVLKEQSAGVITTLSLVVSILSVFLIIMTFAFAARKEPVTPFSLVLRRAVLVVLGVVSLAGIVAALMLIGAAAGIH